MSQLLKNAESQFWANFAEQLEAGGEITPDLDQGASQVGVYVFLVAFVILIIWLTSAATIYQNDLSVRNRRVENIAKAKQVPKRKTAKKTSPSPKRPKKPQTPADSIEVELNQMSAEFGMTSMRPVRKNLHPEQTKWYVFRSGQAEGPYTREQLSLVQRITARTNVRREGETDWTRAGEIAELADFIRAQS